VFLIDFFWSFGIHGVSVVGTVARPLWEVFLVNNADAVASGGAIPHIAPETFYQWFIWIGGSGATLGLVLAMVFFSRSK
ncbi:PTS transporter subunit EIIC, partial [Planococcus sp. SIMBA_143]